jgi:hypothetical protein
LAPTVAPAAAPAGIHIRTGFITTSGERVVSGLVQRLGSLDFIRDNADTFANGPFPRNGSFSLFVAHRIYIGTALARRFPAVVLLAPDPPALSAARGMRTDRTVGSMEVMIAGADGTGKAVADTKDIPTKYGRTTKQALEQQQNNADTSAVPATPTLLQASMDKLATPVAPDANMVAIDPGRVGGATLEPSPRSRRGGPYPAGTEYHPT